MNELKFAVRRLKNPGFTAVAVLTLAVGIGANTAVFSFVNAILLRPLPFRNSEQLVMLFENYAPQGSHHVMVSPPIFEEWRKQTTLIEGLSAGYTHGFRLTGNGPAEALVGSELSANISSLLRIHPFLGRDFAPEEETYGKHRVVLLGYELWQSRFGADTNLVGRDILLNDEHYRVIGVLPPRTFFPDDKTQLWAPLAFDQDEKINRHSHNYRVYGRLKPDVTVAQAEGELQIIASRIALAAPENKDWGAEIQPLREAMVGGSRLALLALLGSVALVLLIVCANVANLQLARSLARAPEFAIRTALGAGRYQILRQLLTESLLLALVGAGAGTLLAAVSLKAIVGFLPADLPRAWEGIQVDGRTLEFTMLISLLAAIIFGLIPALHTSDWAMLRAVGEGGRGGGAGRQHERFRQGLVMSQMALSLILLFSAGLLLRSFDRLLSQDLGYDPEQVASLVVGLTDQRYPDQSARARFFEELLAKVKLLPGFQTAALIAGLPLAGWDAHVGVEVAGAPPRKPQDPGSADYAQISPGYFSAMRLRLMQGRDFTAQDRASAPPVVIVNESFAREFKLGGHVLGQRLSLSDGTHEAEIIGVVRDTKRADLAEASRGEVYRPYQQVCWGQMSLIIRSQQELGEISRVVRSTLDTIDKDSPILGTQTMSQLLSSSVAQRRVSAQMLSGFAGVALLLAGLGLYGVLAYYVKQRTREIGIRMAMGAQPRDVLKLVLTRGITLALAGIGFGLAGAFALSHVLSKFLYATSPLDWVALSGTAFLLGAVALVACWIPARRASAFDPVEALRYE